LLGGGFLFLLIRSSLLLGDISCEFSGVDKRESSARIKFQKAMEMEEEQLE
jgi:hypothetical protein